MLWRYASCGARNKISEMMESNETFCTLATECTNCTKLCLAFRRDASGHGGCVDMYTIWRTGVCRSHGQCMVSFTLPN